MQYNEIKSNSWINITDSEFTMLRELIYSSVGINLTEEKRNLVASRLQKVLRANKLRTFSDYYNFLKEDLSGASIIELSDIISTNHTYFCREKEHYEYLEKTAFPEIVMKKIDQNNDDIRIWSAGCSSGEEPYNIVMLMMEYFGSEYHNFDAGILATDISTRVLNIAVKGEYPYEKIMELPDKFIKKYFRKLPGNMYKLIDEVRKEVTFRRFNLMEEKFPFKKKFDIIFCRNVMIYFDKPTREILINKFYDALENDGYLFIGHSETIDRTTTDFKYIMPALYKKTL